MNNVSELEIKVVCSNSGLILYIDLRSNTYGKEMNPPVTEQWVN